MHSSRVKLFHTRPATGFVLTSDDTAAYVHLCDDIAVVCSKLSPTSHLSKLKRSNLRELQAKRMRTQFAVSSKQSTSN